eukprot:jgi/Botrbrau1/23583/Bobra.0141s0047.1
MGQFGDSAQGEALETANQPGPPPNAPPNAKVFHIYLTLECYLPSELALCLSLDSTICLYWENSHKSGASRSRRLGNTLARVNTYYIQVWRLQVKSSV